MSSVKHLLAVKMIELLQAECIDKLPADDPTRVDEIAIRKMIGSPRLGLVIMHFDPLLQESHSDKTVGAQQSRPKDGLHYPARESTGATFERIDGTVEVIGNFTKTKEDGVEADLYFQEVVSRTHRVLRTNRTAFASLKDTYGEQVLDFTVTGTSEYDSGAKSANTARAFVRWSAMVHASVKE